MSAGTPGGPTMRATIGALVRKDLRLELRTFESVPAMALFAVTTYVLFHFGLDRDALEGDLASGVLWVTLLFAGVLGINRLFVSEHEDHGFDGFLIAPVDRTAMLVAKALALFGYLVALELVAIPAFIVLLLGPAPGADVLAKLALVVLLADVGIAIVGTLVSALAIQTRARDLIGPLLTLPLLVPVVIAAAEATAPLLIADSAGALPGRWLVTLGLYDVVFGSLAFAVFDFLLED